MAAKKILLLINKLELGGGAERIISELGSKLHEKNYDVTFMTFYDSENTYEYKGEKISLNENLFLNYIPIINILKSFDIANKISNHCEKNEIDIIISFLAKPNITAILSKIFSDNSRKIIVSVRNNPLKKSLTNQILMKELFGKANKVVSLSKHIELILKEDFSLKNTTTIYNMQNIKNFKKLSSEELVDEHKKIMNSKSFKFINIGGLHEQKGQWYLVRSFKKVVENSENNIKLIILGEGKLRNDLKNLIEKLGLKKKVFLLGNVNNVFPYIRKSDCFVFSSLYEGFGNVLTEALSQNTPIISTDCIAGPREILCPELDIGEEIDYPYYGKYGILTKPLKKNKFFGTLEEKTLTDEEKIFVNVMIKIIKNEKIRRKYSNGFERVKDFSVDEIIKKWEKIL